MEKNLKFCLPYSKQGTHISYLEYNHLNKYKPMQDNLWICSVVIGGNKMQIFKQKKSMLLLIALVSIFAFGVTASIAQDKVKVKQKAFGVLIKSERVKIDDTEDHYKSISEWKGVTPDGEFIRYGTSAADLIKGNGPFNGYMKDVDKSGDTYITKFQGVLTNTKSQEGKPLVTYKGTFSYIKGTGKFENIEGGGTFKGRFIGEGIYMTEYDGEYVIKK